MGIYAVEGSSRFTKEMVRGRTKRSASNKRLPNLCRSLGGSWSSLPVVEYVHCSHKAIIKERRNRRMGE